MQRHLSLKGSLLTGAALAVLCAPARTASATVMNVINFTPGSNYIGFMNVFELPSNGGGYDFGSSWGTPDLDAAASANVLTITPNTSIDRDVPTDSYWWQAGGTGPGNHVMDASYYVQDATLAGSTVTFTGDVLSDTLVAPYTSVAFIKDFTTGFSLVNSSTAPLADGVFSISLATNPGDIVQYGFETVGPNARLAAVGGLGGIQVTSAAVPEPASLGLLATAGMLLRRRRVQ